MEPIPEDPEFSGTMSPTAKETKSVKREVYRSERVESSVRRVPESYLTNLEGETVEENVSLDNMDPRSSGYGGWSPVETERNLPELSGTSYAYSYESSYDQPPVVAEEVADESGYGPNVERHSTQTQKVTRVTKVTTTRQIQQIPTQVGPEDGPEYSTYDNAQVAASVYSNCGFTALTNGGVPSYDSGGVYALPPPDDENTTGLNSYGEDYYLSQYALPSAPGVPQVVDVDAREVSLVWLRPDRDGDMGDVEGYQVQYHKSFDTHWHPAHSGLIQDTQCTVSSLEPNEEYQFRIVAKNSGGFGEPSTPSPSILLRPKYSGHGGGGNEPLDTVGPVQSQPLYMEEMGVPYPPGRPQVLAMDGNGVTLGWEHPIASGSGGPVAGYVVEYRTIGAPAWLMANDYLIPSCQYSSNVRGLRPNGDYEFRVFAKNADGLSEPSQTIGPIKMRPQVPTRETYIPYGASSGFNVPPPPSQPQALDADSDCATLMWAPPPTPRSGPPPWQLIGYELECREIGDPNWLLASQQVINGTQYTVRGLHPNSTYEFRVFARSPEGLSEPSEVSELVQLRPKMQGPPRGVPAKPSPPEIMEVEGDQVTLCWLPTHSSLPVQGYDVQFRDFAQGSWFKVNELLMQSCKMTIGDLSIGQTYEFRVTAKNAMGYSDPSEPSEPLTVGVGTYVGPSTSVKTAPAPALQREPSFSGYASDANVPLQVELDKARESPPIPDRDDSPPPIHRPFSGADGVQWRDPTLPEVLDYLNSSNNVIRLNAAGYLQHLTYHDNEVKRKTRELNGVPKLIDLLSSDVPEIQKNACGCLRNLSYGSENEENKHAIHRAGGIVALTELLRKTPDMQVKEEITGALWNLSSTDVTGHFKITSHNLNNVKALKRPILQYAVEPIVQQVIIPGSGWSPSNDHVPDPLRSYNPNVFRNGTGVIRNVSATGDEARRSLRELKDFVDALVYYLNISVQKRAEYDTKTVENVVCILRNLSYKCQEVEDPNYDKNFPTSARDNRSKSAPSGSPKVKTKKESKIFGTKKKGKDGSPLVHSPHLKRPVQGMALLWQPEIVKHYIKLLQEANNPVTLEASAGAIQNLAACYWQPSVDIRAAVRKEKGLPTLVELLRVDADKAVCAVATALRNLALDSNNRELIGKYAMKDLVHKLPEPNRAPDRTVSDETLCAVLGVMYETVRTSVDFTRSLHDSGGTARLVGITNAPQFYTARVVKYTSQVLNMMWQHRELQELFRRSGFHESQFIVRGRYADATTLARPISTQGPERLHSSRLRPDLDDSYNSNPHSAGYGAMGSTSSIPEYSRRDPPVNMRHYNGNGRSSYPAQHGRGEQMPLNAGPEPLYAQVRKRNSNEPPQHVVYERNSRFAGDSWV